MLKQIWRKCIYKKINPLSLHFCRSLEITCYHATLCISRLRWHSEWWSPGIHVCFIGWSASLDSLVWKFSEIIFIVNFLLYWWKCSSAATPDFCPLSSYNIINDCTLYLILLNIFNFVCLILWKVMIPIVNHYRNIHLDL